jgi:hypothetical protein
MHSEIRNGLGDKEFRKPKTLTPRWKRELTTWAKNRERREFPESAGSKPGFESKNPLITHKQRAKPGSDEIA